MNRMISDSVPTAAAEAVRKAIAAQREQLFAVLRRRSGGQVDPEEVLHRARNALKERLASHCGTTAVRACTDCGCKERGCCPEP